MLTIGAVQLDSEMMARDQNVSERILLEFNVGQPERSAHMAGILAEYLLDELP